MATLLAALLTNQQGKQAGQGNAGEPEGRISRSPSPAPEPEDPKPDPVKKTPLEILFTTVKFASRTLVSMTRGGDDMEDQRNNHYHGVGRDHPRRVTLNTLNLLNSPLRQRRP